MKYRIAELNTDRFHSCWLGMFLLILTGMAACKQNDAPDVSDIGVRLQTSRLDQDMARLDTNTLTSGLQQLRSRYPDFFDFYMDTLMGFGVNGNYADTALAIRQGVKGFLTHRDYRGLFDTVAKHFPDTREIDEDLKQGFQYMKHYFPRFEEPRVIYLITGLNNNGAFTVGDDILCIGLDMYLGPSYPFYASVGVPAYALKNMVPERAAVDAFSRIYTLMHPFVMENRTLLDLMIQKGKEQYFLSQVLPFKEEHLRLGYTEEQLEWCRENEAEAYNFFIKNNLLYETNWQKILRYVNEGPSATGMPPESPGHIGYWLGLQIVRSYLKQHPKMTMQELFEQQDAQRLLQEAKYRP